MKKIPYSIKVDESVLEDIKKVAKDKHRSVNNTIEVALIDYVETSKKKK